MSRITPFYSSDYLFYEGIALGHPDIKGQKEFAQRADAELERRRKRRARASQVELPRFRGTDKPSFQAEDYVYERSMTSKERQKEERLKNKFDDSEMKANFIQQYGPEKGKQIYFAYIRKQAMKEDLEIFEAKLPRSQRKKNKKSKGSVHAFDVDETLFSHGVKGKPNVKVHVKDSSGKRVKSLSNQEFNTHKLEPGHSYDFSEFRSARKFSQTASPNKKVISQLKRLQRRGKNVHLITARDKFDNPEEFRQHFTRHGINIKPGNIHYTGGMKGSDIGKKKVAVAKGVAKMSGSKNIHMYDDAAKVHKAFEAEKEKNSNLKIKTHLAKPNKKGEVMTRSYQAVKEDFELWIDELLNEGYDLSDITLEELEGIYIDAFLGESYEEERLFKSPYREIMSYDFSEKEINEELSPYEYWKNYIVEDVEDYFDEDDEEYDEELDENYEPTSYEIWRAYLGEKYINEQEEEEADPTQQATDRHRAYQKAQRKSKLVASIRQAADELEET